MNWDRIEGNWKQSKGNMKQQWGKLTDDHLDVIAGKREEFAGKIQEIWRRQRRSREADFQMAGSPERSQSVTDWHSDSLPRSVVGEL